MAVALRSVFTASVALAGAGVIAVSPITPAHDVHLPQVHAPAIELLASVPPAFGGSLYEILVNQFGNFLAATPILIGSTEQCTVCLGPAPGVNPIPYTGWGAIGITAGLLNTVPAFFDALTSGSGLLAAFGEAGLAAQTPITNTLALISNDRVPYGGFQLEDTIDRALAAAQQALNGIYETTTQLLIKTPITLVGGVVVGLQTFAQTLAVTGNFLTSVEAGLAPIVASVDTAATDLVDVIQTNREALYDVLGTGPGPATHPIPTYDSDAPAAPGAAAIKAASKAAERAGGAAKKSAGAGNPDAADHASTGSDGGAKTGGGHSAKHGAGSKRQKAASGD